MACYRECCWTFLQNASLQTLVLSSTKFSGFLPKFIGNLKRLQTMDLFACSFHEIIKSFISGQNQLVSLEPSYNNLSDPLLSFSLTNNMKYIDMRSNSLISFIISTNWSNLLNLELLDRSDNPLTGSIPASLFSAPLLQQI